MKLIILSVISIFDNDFANLQRLYQQKYIILYENVRQMTVFD